MTSENRVYLRPLPCPPLPAGRAGARPLAGGPFTFAEVEVLSRGAPPQVLPVDAVVALYPENSAVLARLSASRAPVAELDLARPRLMGVVNVTPDSFSDGGRLENSTAAIAHGLALAEAGADILDIGGESTRPGADPVPLERELDRVMPVIEGLVQHGCPVPISIDTRKAAVAKAALAAGAVIFNDVSALTYDPDSAGVAADAPALCLMHAQGDPRTMQKNPQYDDVLLDVFDFLEARIAAAKAAGIDADRIVIDPGIGFGKTLEHNLSLIRRVSLYHGLGCPILLGISRKRFIGTLSGVQVASERVAGSIAAGLAGLAEGVQMLRVHDVAETRQAVQVWQAIALGRED